MQLINFSITCAYNLSLSFAVNVVHPHSISPLETEYRLVVENANILRTASQIPGQLSKSIAIRGVHRIGFNRLIGRLVCRTVGWGIQWESYYSNRSVLHVGFSRASSRWTTSPSTSFVPKNVAIFHSLVDLLMADHSSLSAFDVL